MTRPLCLYHANCADGFAAAWVVRKFFAGEVDLMPVNYNETLPWDAALDRDVYIVDFSYSLDMLMRLAAGARNVVVLDHHKTARDTLGGLPYAHSVKDDLSVGPVLRAQFDMERSGAGITWDYFYPGKMRPPLVAYAEDRDLWRFKYDDSKDVHAALMSYPWDFEIWDTFHAGMETGDETVLMMLVAEGKAIRRRMDQDIDELIKGGHRMVNLNGFLMPAINMPYQWMSEGLQRLYEKTGDECAAAFYDEPAGRKWSLRSKASFDASVIAKHYGGGGHAQACGFHSAHGWFGDDII